MTTEIEVATLLTLETRRAEAIGTGDLEALADVLAADYVHVLAPGRVVNKAQYIEMIRTAPRKPERGALHVRSYGDAAVITGDLTNHIGAPGSAQRVIPAYCTQVAVNANGQWRFVSYILTRKRDAS